METIIKGTLTVLFLYVVAASVLYYTGINTHLTADIIALLH